MFPKFQFFALLKFLKLIYVQNLHIAI